MFREESARFVSDPPEMVRPSISITNTAMDRADLFEALSALTTIRELSDASSRMSEHKLLLTILEIHQRLGLLAEW